MELSLAAPAGTSGAGIVALSTHDARLSLSTTTAPPTLLSVGAQRAAQVVASRGGGSSGVALLLNGRDWRFSVALQRSHWLCPNCDKAVPNERETCSASTVQARLTQQESLRRESDLPNVAAYARGA